MKTLDRATLEVVLSNVAYVLIASFVTAASIENMELLSAYISARTAMLVGELSMVVAFICAIAHQSVARVEDRRLWTTAIAFSWTGSLLIVYAMIVPPWHPSKMLYLLVAIMLLTAATSIRALRPRDRMWTCIQETRELLSTIESNKKQLSLTLKSK